MFNRWQPRTYIIMLAICALVLVVLRVGWELRWSPEYLTAWGNFLTGIGTLVIALGAVYAGYIGIGEYREKTHVEKTKWLSDLFKQLFVDQTFKKIRQQIDFNEMDDIRELLTKEMAWQVRGEMPTFSQQEKDLLDSFTDYLNFFEFVGLLQKLGRLTDADIESLFDYYIRRFVEVDSDNKIRRYLRHLNFENLNHLLNQVSQYVFVYGTLKKGGSRHKLVATSGLKFVGNGKTLGHLYCLPGQDYPAGIIAPASHYVHGELYKIRDNYTHEWLNDIDLEEGVDEGLYARVLREIEAEGKTVKAWVYTYLQPVDPDLEIHTGVFPVT